MQTKTIPTNAFLVFLLFQKDFVSHSEIKKSKHEIERIFPDFYIDITEPNLYNSCVGHFPEMFKWSKEGISRSKRSEVFFKKQHVLSFLRIYLPEKIYIHMKKKLKKMK